MLADTHGNTIHWGTRLLNPKKAPKAA
ncbi:hypothetical protein PO124_08750 [Bacillus licheniformis]|nr:hypothetical protein [Bacillus licheniformis]